MVTLDDAYRLLKNISAFPMTYIIETPDGYWGPADDYVKVDKESGEITHVSYYGYFLMELSEDKFVDLDELYKDFLEYYSNNPSEENLSTLYAAAANRMFYHMNGRLEDYNSAEDQKRMISKWTEIEQILYKDR